MSCISNERFGTSEGGSGWTWDKGGIGMGGKDAGIIMITISKQLIRVLEFKIRYDNFVSFLQG